MTSKADLLAKALKPAEEALRLHAHYKGKMQSMPKCAVRSLDDFALWYTPGVAAPCKAIQADPDRVFDYTNRGNTIAVVSDGTRVLGLGDIGPEAALPVMEGKALLFKYLGGVDAVPICLKTKDPNEVIRTVLLLAPSFGAINLEDIAMPKCFHVLRELQARCSIPVWHDDQQGTGTVLLAGLMNALQVVGKELGRVRIAMIGMGAANVPVYRFLTASGADPARIVACDLGGILGTHRREYECDPAFAEQWRVCLHSNPDRLKGALPRPCEGPTSASPFPPAASSSRSGSEEWRETPSSLPAQTRFRRSGLGKPRKPGRESWRPDAAISRTRSTIRWCFPASFAGCSTCGRAPSPTRWRWRLRMNSRCALGNAASTRRVFCRRWRNGTCRCGWRWPRPLKHRSRGWRRWNALATRSIF